VPIYYNELNIPHTIPRLKKLQELVPDVDLEFIFVDDGSSDRSFELLMAERKKDSRIKVIKLSRNFGSIAAIQTGLKFATGNCVGVIAADLQDPPELFADMIDLWQKGNKVVLACRKEREDSNIFSSIFYFAMRKFAIKDYPKGGFDFFLLDKQVVAEVNNMQEKNTNISTLIYWMGYSRASISYTREKRQHGRSRWTFSKKVKLFVDTFVNFSYFPIRFISFTGVMVAFFSFLYGLFIIATKIGGFVSIPGWTSIIAVVTFLLGIQMLMLGIMGEYLWRMLDETRKRPNYIIDSTFID
jgi:dolichol-phosphate mannosyltransferase